MIEPIHATITLPWSTAATFDRFTRLAEWWPREYTWSGAVLVTIGIDPRAGGLCFEEGPNGFRCDWGRVLVWEPPRRLLLAWQIGPQREPVPNPARASEVEFRFNARDGGETTLSLEHRRFEAHGAGAEAYRNALAAPEGWPYILRRLTAPAT